MTGPEHYREAERLLRDEYRTDRNVAEAQVHATLALAAATADQPALEPADSLMRRAWRAVTGPFIKAATGGSR
nr:hypothetical protein OG409_07785 [Streptomyces sp. NBC_00974]